MSDPVITIENLSKAYRIGLLDEAADTIAGTLMSWVRAPVRNFRALRNLGRFDSEESAEDVLWALRDVNLEVSRGEVLGVIGRNGAGKSTLLKVLSRITEPTTGRAVLRGRVASLLEVGTGFHPELTGRENTYMNGTILGMRKREIDHKLDAIVEFSGIERFFDTPVKRYSSGMRVRLAFAVAAHLEPEILIIDEVLAVGDAEFQERCLGKMRDVARGGRTVLFVSHNMTAVGSLCTSCVIVEGGLVGEKGAVAERVDEYLGGTRSVSCDVDLVDHDGRAPGRSTILRRWQVLGADGEPLGSIPIGGDVEFVVEAECSEPVQDVHLGIRILGSRGVRLTTPHTRFQLARGCSFPGRLRFRCRMQNLRLLPGHYRVELDLTSQMRPLDYIQSGLGFEVLPRDVYGTGRLPPSRTGVIAPDAAWTIEQEPATGGHGEP